ncbi:unnamed protein product [Staurois parvus]|uniref:Uncharacterized protein n=1 Tax=Staurois parvus TaxID=386267 RepID=A0ABN9DUJ6_9NEOB|nr:unnamed protein product [Staurois parvus]
MHLLIVQSSRSHSAHAQFSVIFFSWESACDQHRANQYCPEGQGFCILLEQN